MGIERCYEKSVDSSEDELEVPCNNHRHCPIKPRCACLMRRFGCLDEPTVNKCKRCVKNNENIFEKRECTDVDAIKEICSTKGEGMCEDDEDNSSSADEEHS